MKNIEELIDFLNSEDGRKALIKYVKKENIQNERINKIISNTKYINWLIEFTNKMEFFSDYASLYNRNKLSKEDYENTMKLFLFYEGINTYAINNHIYPIKENNIKFYRIKFNDIGFKIGIIHGQGTIQFCKRIEIDNENEFIDFDDIMNSKKQDNVDIINNKLNALASLIKTIYQDGVPIEDIIYTMNLTINEIRQEKEDKVKTLIKK